MACWLSGRYGRHCRVASRTVSGIFISYRRDDSEGHARSLYQALVARGLTVYLDVVGIGTGKDFRVEIDRMVASSDVVLAVIGNKWASVQGKDGRRRIDSKNDLVRLEVATALRRDIPVVPVFVQGAEMPSEDELPDDLKALAYRHGISLSHAKWDSDVSVLVNSLPSLIQEKALSARPNSHPSVPFASKARAGASLRRSGWPRMIVWGAGCLVGLAVVIFLADPIRIPTLQVASLPIATASRPVVSAEPQSGTSVPPNAIKVPGSEASTPEAVVHRSASEVAQAQVEGDAVTLYITKCSVCHSSGANGAPRFGVPREWERYKGEGVDKLTAAILRSKGKAHSTAHDVPADIIRAAVEYMLASVK